MVLLRLRITLVFSIGVICYLAVGFPDSIRKQTLCKDQEPAILNCNSDRVISIQKTEGQINHCSIECDTKFLEYLKALCDGQNTCHVTSDIFPNECNRFARYLRIGFDCSGVWGRERKYFDTCSNTLSQIHCRGYGWGGRHIHFTTVNVMSKPECDNVADRTCLWNKLYHLCDENEACSEDIYPPNSCLFEKPFMHIFYLCSDNIIKTTSNTPIDAVTPVISDGLTTSTKKIFTESTDLKHRNPMIVLNGSLLLVQDTELQSSRNVLCADDWNDKAASVVCKFLNISVHGRSLVLVITENYGVINMSLNCTGQEASLQECEFVEKPCSSTMAAGICCDDKIDCPNRMSAIAISPSSKESFGNIEHTGLIVGVVVGLVIVCLVVVGTLFCLKRFNYLKTNESEGHNPGFRTEMREANENQNYDCLERRNPNDHIYDVRFDATNQQSSDVQGVAYENQNYDCLERRNPNDHIYDVRFDATNQQSSDIQGAVYTSIDYEVPKDNTGSANTIQGDNDTHYVNSSFAR